MYLKHKIVYLDLSQEDFNALIRESALSNVSVNKMANSVIEKWLRVRHAQLAENPQAVQAQYLIQKKLLSPADAFLPWLASNRRLGELVGHMESIFKTLLSMKCPCYYIKNDRDHLAVQMIFINILKDYYSDLAIPAEKNTLDEYFGVATEAVTNLEHHFTAIRKIFESYAFSESPKCDVADAVNAVLCWWKATYAGE